MGLEIEVKLRVEAHKAVEEKLAELGAEFICEELQTDYYFDDAKRDIERNDSALRLRVASNGEKEKFVLSFKGPKLFSRFKAREEYQSRIDDMEAVIKILSELGYEKSLVFQKKRRKWKFMDCLVCLDELPRLGSFIEIEGPDEKTIADVQDKLGLGELKHVAKSYATLITEELGTKGKGERKVFF